MKGIETKKLIVSYILLELVTISTVTGSQAVGDGALPLLHPEIDGSHKGAGEVDLSESSVGGPRGILTVTRCGFKVRRLHKHFLARFWGRGKNRTTYPDSKPVAGRVKICLCKLELLN